MKNHAHTSLYYPPINTPKKYLPTPALLVDLPGLEFNLALMSRFFEQKPAKLRPHFKTHKCPIIAKNRWNTERLELHAPNLAKLKWWWIQG
jgi:hypothetical protein